MNKNEVLNLSKSLKGLSLYVKNLIVYKANESGEDYVHIKAFQPVLERIMEDHKGFGSFFNGKKNRVHQFLDYLLSCGELVKLEYGYYAVLPSRKVHLPMSNWILKIGKLKMDLNEGRNLSLAIPAQGTLGNIITLNDYRYDYSMRDWLLVFQRTTKSITLFDGEYFKPTEVGLKRIHSEDIKDGQLHYILSYPFGEMKEHYIALKKDGEWYGEKVNENLWKSRLSLLVNEGYCPTYQINKLNKSTIFQITLSDFLPETEREQIYLFSLPQQLNYCKKYYVREEYLRDFLYVLKEIKYLERSDE